jgi:hypothetical protein
VSLPAGSGLPETSISVVNGAGNRVVKSLIGGQRQQLKVVSTPISSQLHTRHFCSL